MALNKLFIVNMLAEELQDKSDQFKIHFNP